MNRILKQRARQLYGANLGRIFRIYLIYYLYLLIGLAPVLLEGSIGLLASGLLQMALMVFIWPITLGVLRFGYLLHQDKAPGAGEAFYYFRSPARYGKAVGLGLIQNIPTYLSLFLSSLSSETSSPQFLLVTTFLMTACYAWLIYWSLHVCLMSYILVEDEGADLGHIRRESFRLMKGNCGKYFGLNLSFIGWYLAGMGVLVAVLMAIIMPAALRSARLGLPLGENMMEPYLIWVEMGVYALFTLLAPYISLANAGFADAALRGRLMELSWQGSPPYAPPYGAPGAYPPPSYPQQPPYPQAGAQWGQPYPPRQAPQGPAWGPGPGQNPGAAQGPAPQGPGYSAAQREEAEQYARYRQGQPMSPKSFLSYGTAPADLGNFYPWVQVEQSDLYSFLKLENWMPGMVGAAYRQCAGDMASFAPGSGASARRSLEETLSGTRFRVSVTLSDDPGAGCCRVQIQIDLNP